MGQKRFTRAQVQQQLDQVLDKIRRLHPYAGNVHAQVEAELGSTSIPPQQWRGQLENDERMGEYYKQMTEILKAQVAEEAEKCKALEEDYKSAKWAVFMMRDELEILKLKKTDPELNDSQRQVLSNIKTKLLEYPTMLGEVTGNETFMQAVKKSYESKLEGFETKLEKLTRDVFGLPMTCSNKVSTSLTDFAETILMPAISIVKHQHEELETELDEANERSKVLETELGEANERSIRLEKRIEQLEAEAENARVDITSLTSEHSIREQKLTNDIAALEKKFKATRDAYHAQKQTHQYETTKLAAQVENARTTAAAEVKVFKGEIESYRGTVKELEKGKEALEDQLSTAEDEKQSLERSFHGQLSAVKSENESLKHSLEKEMQSFRSRLSTAESETLSLMQAREKKSWSFQTQLLSSKSDNESLRQSMEKEMQSLRDQLSAANEANESLRAQFSTTDDTNKSLVRSKQELEARYCGATESLESKSRLLELHISILDNHDLVAEMEDLSGMTERYTGSTTEMVSMPKYMPRIRLVGKAVDLPEPNLAAARCLWISSCCGPLALDITQAFFIQRKISSAQFALLPWIHASLNRAVTMICEKSTLTPDLAISSAWILQGLVYTATVAREWSSVWNPKIEGILAQMTHWLGEHVSDEASLLMVIVGQVNDIVTTREPPSTSISPSVVSESRRIDSANSSIPDGMTIVVDTSGIFILFTADDAFIFGANEVKIIEVDLRGGILIKFEQAVKGLPVTLMELRLLDLHSPVEVVNRHQALLKSVLTKDRIEYTNPYKRRRQR